MLPPQRLGRPPIAAAARRRGTAVQSRLQADATQGHACTLPAIEVRAEKPALLQCLRPPVGESRWRVGGALSRGNLTLQIANHTRVTGVGSPTHKCPTVASVVSPRRLHRRVFVLPRKHKRGAHTHAATAHDDETHTPRRTQRRAATLPLRLLLLWSRWPTHGRANTEAAASARLARAHTHTVCWGSGTNQASHSSSLLHTPSTPTQSSCSSTFHVYLGERTRHTRERGAALRE